MIRPEDYPGEGFTGRFRVRYSDGSSVILEAATPDAAVRAGLRIQPGQFVRRVKLLERIDSEIPR